MRRNLRIFPWWWVLRWVWLGEGIWVLYLTEERGVTLGQVLVFEALYAGVVLLTELPTGMVADRYGRRVSAIAGTAFVAVGFLAFGASTSFSLLLAGYALLAIAETSFSGADTALLYDSLKAERREEDFTTWHGRLNAAAFVAIAAFTTAGSVMVRWWPMWTPIVLSGLLTIPVIVLAWLLREPPRGDERHSYLGTGRHAVALVARRPALIALMVLMAVTTQSIVIMAVLQQRFLVDAGVPVWAVGLVIAAQLAFAATGSWLSGAIGRRFSQAGIFLWMPLLSAATLAAGVPGVLWLYPVFVFASLGWNVMFPHFTDYLARRVTDSLRATTMSIGSAVGSLTAIAGMPALGWAMDRHGFGPTLLGTSAVLTAVAALAYLVWARVGGAAPPDIDAASVRDVPSGATAEAS